MLMTIATAIPMLAVLVTPGANVPAPRAAGARAHLLAQRAGGWRAAPPPGGWRGTPPPPPARPVERVQRRRGFVWVQGDYELRDGSYFWVRGHLEPAQEGRSWHSGRWEWQGDRYVWLRGQWLDGAAYSPAPQFVVNTPPPPVPVVVVQPPPPRPGFVSIAPSHEWRDGRYMPVEGRWEPERGDQRWEAGHWDHDGDRHAWHQGGWQRRDHDDDHDGDHDHDHGRHRGWDHGRGHDRDDRQ